ncbi:MAG: HdeD family acid-resistance protein [Solirubrobacteraceae bacterium]
MAETGLEEEVLSAFRWVRWGFAILGVLCVVAGVIVLAEPHSLATLAVISGIFLVVDGIFEIVAAVVDGPEGRALRVVFGVVCGVIGIILIRHPTQSVVAIALLVGLWFVIAGVLRVVTALVERPRRGWMAVLGAVELLAGIVIVSSPDIGVATLALLVGIGFILRGLMLCVVAWLIGRLVGEATDAASGALTAS